MSIQTEWSIPWIFEKKKTKKPTPRHNTVKFQNTGGKYKIKSQLSDRRATKKIDPKKNGFYTRVTLKFSRASLDIQALKKYTSHEFFLRRLQKVVVHQNSQRNQLK